jgi:hypothetical protein
MIDKDLIRQKVGNIQNCLNSIRKYTDNLNPALQALGRVLGENTMYFLQVIQSEEMPRE